MPITFDFSKNLAGVEQAAFDAMPEDVRPFYEKGADGKYAVSATARPLVDTLVGVVAGLRDERGKAKRFGEESIQHRNAAKAYEEYVSELGLSAEEGKTLVDALKSHVSTLTDQVKGGKEANINLDKVRGEFQKKLADVAAAKDADIAKMRGSLERHLVNDEATRSLAAEKGNPVLLLPHVKASTKVVLDGENYVVRVVDAQGDIRTTGTGTMMTVADLVKEMRGDKNFAAGFESEAKGGTGTSTNQRQQQSQRREGADLSSVDKINIGLRKLAAAG